jgi:hypothetical protein
VQVNVFTVVSLAIHLSKETGHGGKVSQNEGREGCEVNRDSFCVQSRQLYYFILECLYIIENISPLIPHVKVLFSVIHCDEHAASKCEK